MKRINANKIGGFTLSELLVVIAIIGILSSIVLVSLNSARGKGNDAKIQEQMNSFRAGAEIYYSGQNGYSDGTVAPIAFTVTNMAIPSVAKDIFDSAASSTVYISLQNAKLPPGTLVYYTRDGDSTTKATAYAVVATLSTASTGWCVDSTGASKSKTWTFPLNTASQLFTGNACK